MLHVYAPLAEGEGPLTVLRRTRTGDAFEDVSRIGGSVVHTPRNGALGKALSSDG